MKSDSLRKFLSLRFELTFLQARKIVYSALNMDVVFFLSEKAKADRKIGPKVEALEKLIDRTRFSIHHLATSELAKAPWSSNSKLVVLTCNSLNNESMEKLQSFQNCGGLVCSLNSNLEIEGALNLFGQSEHILEKLPKELLEFGAESSVNEQDLIGSFTHTNGTLLGTEIIRNSSSKSILTGQSLTNKQFSLLAIDQNLLEDSTIKSSENELYFTTAETSPLFDYSKFSQTFTTNCEENHISSNKNPPLVLHAEVVNSTMDVSKLLSDSGIHDVICVADVQLQGKGRRTNKWISNRGCAMMSFSLSLCNSGEQNSCYDGIVGKSENVNKLMTECPSTVQHIAAMSVVKSLKALAPKESNLPVVIKWPNDIYIIPDDGKNGFREKGTKIGGVLVNGEFCSDGQMKFLVGIGINLDNQTPTVSVNQHLPSESKILREDLLASIYANFSYFTNYAAKYRFNDTLINEYCSMWMHSDQEIEFIELESNHKIENPESLTKKKKGVIKSVDSQGFLLVQPVDSTSEKSVITLHPDGNSFDLTKNLIFPVDRRRK